MGDEKKARQELEREVMKANEAAKKASADLEKYMEPVVAAAVANGANKGDLNGIIMTLPECAARFNLWRKYLA